MATRSSASKELTVTESGAMRPDWVEKSKEGTEHITQQDIQMPRLALAQKTSDQLDESKPMFIDGLKFKDIFNDLTEHIYGRGPVEICVIKSSEPRGVEFKPFDDGGGVVDLNVPLDDDRMQFGPNGETPVATLFYDYVVLILESDKVPTMENLAVLSFKSTALKVAKMLNSLIKMRNAPIFAGRYALESDQDTKNSNTFAIWKIRNKGWLTKEEYDFAKNAHDALKDFDTSAVREREAADHAQSAGAGDTASGGEAVADIPF